MGSSGGTPDTTVARVVFDTNVVVSALVFPSGLLHCLRASWMAGRCIPVATEDTVRELFRVLLYPTFRLSQSDRHELLADYLPWVEWYTFQRMPGPRCGDAADQVFVDLAVSAKVDALVSGDAHIVSISSELTSWGESSVRVVSPRDAVARWCG